MRTSARRPRKASIGLVTLAATLLLAAPTHAGNVYNVTLQLPADVRENPCTPYDVITFQGTLHMVMSLTADNRGGYHVSMEKNWVLDGQSIGTGIDYRGSQTSIQSVYMPAGTSTTTKDDVRLLSQASAENFLFHANTRIVVAEAGVPVVTVENVRMECAG